VRPYTSTVGGLSGGRCDLHRTTLAQSAGLATEEGGAGLAARLVVATREFVSLERYADAEEHADGNATLSYRVASIDWLVRRVLQYGAEAEVLEPRFIAQRCGGPRSGNPYARP
jgi:hypothetical protein